MQYIMFVIDDQSASANGNEMAAIDAFNDQLRADGYWVIAAGIGRPASATVVDNRGNLGQMNNGSLFDTLEHYSGFWIVNVPSADVALQLALAGSNACNRKVELRPFL
ncbi:MAG: hypothetical protein FJ040_05665 [Chloroflexi bacterium]|nr:hypothetical protein [Chloroflexota bacterium]